MERNSVRRQRDSARSAIADWMRRRALRAFFAATLTRPSNTVAPWSSGINRCRVGTARSSPVEPSATAAQYRWSGSSLSAASHNAGMMAGVNSASALAM